MCAGLLKIYMGFFILGAPTFTESHFAIETFAHIALKECPKNVCACFMKLFAPKDNCLFLRHSNSQNWP